MKILKSINYEENEMQDCMIEFYLNQKKYNKISTGQVST